MKSNKMLLVLLVLFTPQVVLADTIIINEGAQYTNSSSVLVNITSDIGYVFITNLSRLLWENISVGVSIQNVNNTEGNKVIKITNNSASNGLRIYEYYPTNYSLTSITLDITPPIITITTPSNNTEYYYESVPSTCNITFTDNLSGINNSTKSSCSINNTEGSHSIIVSVQDNASNPTTKTIFYSVNGTPQPSTRNVTRSFSKDYLNGINDSIKVTINIDGEEPFFTVNETIPSFFNVTNILGNVTNTTNGSVYTFVILGSSFSYNLSSLLTNYSVHTLNGTFKDSYRYYGNIIGNSTIRLLNPESSWVQQWDSTGDGYINRNEVIDSVFNGYFGGQLSMFQTLVIIGYYFSHTYIGG